MNDAFKKFVEMISCMENISSQTAKKKILSQFLREDMDIVDYINAACNPFFQYRLTHTMAIAKGVLILSTLPKKLEILSLLQSLREGQYSGNQAANLWKTCTHPLSIREREIAGRILDKDLKCRIGCKLINTVFRELRLDPIPVHEVSLGYKYDGELIWQDSKSWFASRKLDGVRCQAVLGHGKPVLLSRQGKPFETLEVLEKELEKYSGKPVILDGELSLVKESGIVEGYKEVKDDFQGLMKEIRRKNHTIQNICFHLFDIIPVNEKNYLPFSKRIRHLKKVVQKLESKKLKCIKQIKIKDEEHFERLMSKARDKGWEGLMLRKNTIYKSGRSKDLLKVKDMQDLEAEVIAIETGTMNIVKKGREKAIDTMSRAVILHRGSKVGVGSGWSVKQRQYYFKHPEELIGKIITVQYFEETKNQGGGYGLRFPVCKIVHGAERLT
jgi:DNA ligase-1